MRRAAFSFSLGLAAIAATASCAVIVGFEDNQLGEGGAGGGGGQGPGGGGAGGSGPAPGELLWEVHFGENGYDEIYSATIDAAGNVYILGDFEGTIDIGGGPLIGTLYGYYGLVLAKFNGGGSHLWSQAFNVDVLDAYFDIGSQKLAIDGAGDATFTGLYTGAMTDLGGGPLPDFVVGAALGKRAAQDGGFVWSKGFGNDAEVVVKYVAADPQGGVVLTGRLVGQTTLGGGLIGGAAGVDTVFVAKLDAAGNHVFSVAFDGGLEEAGGLAIDPNGDLVVMGTFDQPLTIGGTTVTSQGATDVFLAKFDGSGAPLWLTSFGGAGFELASQVATDSQGNLFITGNFEQIVDFGGGPLTALGTNGDSFLVGLDSTGGYRLGVRFAASDYQDIRGLAVDNAGNIVITGSFRGQIDLGGETLVAVNDAACDGCYPDAFIVKLDPTGNVVWGKSYGDGGEQLGMGVATDAAGNVYAVGAFAGTTDFGAGPIASRGMLDAYLLKLAP